MLHFPRKSMTIHKKGIKILKILRNGVEMGKRGLIEKKYIYFIGNIWTLNSEQPFVWCLLSKKKDQWQTSKKALHFFWVLKGFTIEKRTVNTQKLAKYNSWQFYSMIYSFSYRILKKKNAKISEKCLLQTLENYTTEIGIHHMLILIVHPK